MNQALPEAAAELAPQVLGNCRRSDARVSGHFSLCGLLMRLRNLYKWEGNIDPWLEQKPGEALDWVSEREELWLELIEDEPQPLMLDGRSLDPFDLEAVNQVLEPEGYLYGAGLAGGLIPAFFLGRIEKVHLENGMKVYQVGEELTQDILFLSGMRQAGQIFLRKTPLAYLVWDKIADPRKSLIKFLDFGLAGYGLDHAEVMRRPSWEALSPVLKGEMQAVLWHEKGEAASAQEASRMLALVLAEHPASDMEHFVRGVGDLLADTGPVGRLASIIEARAEGTLGLYPAWLAGFPRMLFPEVDAAIMEYMKARDWGIIEEVRELGYARAQEAARRIAPYLEQDGDGKEIRQAARREVIEPLTQGREGPLAGG